MSIMDLGMLRGFGIYEGITAFNGSPFHFGEHWERFQRSAEALGLTLPFTQQAAEDAIKEIVGINSPDTRANIRMVLTGGEALGGLEHVAGRETFYLTAEPAEPLPSECYEKGTSLITHEHQRFLPEYKTTNYITAVRLQPKRKEAKAIEILFVKDGEVLECATSNVCIVKDGTIIAPVDRILPGITRKVALQIARTAYPVKEQLVSVEELFSADEVFITSSFKDIVPVVEIDGRTIGSGMPGPITKDLIERFKEHTKTH